MLIRRSNLHFFKALRNEIYKSFSLIIIPSPSASVQAYLTKMTNIFKFHVYFMFYDKHQKTFIQKGLLINIRQLKECTINEYNKDVVEIVQHWLRGEIEIEPMTLYQIQTFLKITMGLIKKQAHPQLNQLVESLSQKMQNWLKTSKIDSNNLIKYFKVLQFVLRVKVNKEQLINVVQAKFSEFLDSSQQLDQKTIQIALQFFHAHGIEDPKIKFFNKLSLKQIIDQQTLIDYIPPKLLHQNLPQICSYIQKEVQNSNTHNIGFKRLLNFFKLIQPYPNSKEVINTNIIIVQHLFWVAEKTKILEGFEQQKKTTPLGVDKHIIPFMLQILSDQGCSLFIFYKLRHQSKQLKQLFKIERYLPFHKEHPLNQTIILILIHINRGLVSTQQASAIRREFDKIFKDLSAFLNFYQTIQAFNLPYLFQSLHQIFHFQFQRLDNPFALRKIDQYSNRQRLYFMNYFFRAYGYQDKKIFIKHHISQITPEFLFQAVSLHLDQNQVSFSHDKYYNFLLICTFKEAIATSNAKLLELGLTFLIKYRKPGIQRTQNQYTELKVWKLIDKYIYNIQKIIQLSLETPFFNMLRSFIDIEQKNYKHDYHYKKLIKNVLKIIPHIENYKDIVQIIISEALQLNLIDDLLRYVGNSIKIDESSLSKAHQLKLACIKARQVKIDTIKENMIEALLVNAKYGYIIKQRINQITSILEKAHPQTLFNCLAAYNLPKSEENHKILNLLLKLATEKLVPKNVHRIDSISIFQQCLKLNNFNIQGYYKLWFEYIDIILYKIHRMTFESHIKHLQFLNTQPTNRMSRKNDQTVKKFLVRLYKSSQGDTLLYNSTYINICYQFAITNFPFKSRQLNHLKRVLFEMKPKFMKIKGIALMLMYQNYFKQEEIKLIIEQLIKFCQTQERIKLEDYPLIYDLHYAYLRAKYPEITKKLSFRNSQCQPYIFTNNHPKLYVQIIDIICKQVQCSHSSFDFGRNRLIRIKDTVLVFIDPFKNGCVKEHQLIIRMIQHQHKEKKVDVVIVNFFDESTYQADILNKLLRKSTLISQQQHKRLLQVVKSRASKAMKEAEAKVEEKEMEQQKPEDDEDQINDIATVQNEAEQQEEQQDGEMAQ